MRRGVDRPHDRALQVRESVEQQRHAVLVLAHGDAVELVRRPPRELQRQARLVLRPTASRNVSWSTTALIAASSGSSLGLKPCSPPR